MAVKFVRKIDELGRIVIPKDVRNMLSLKPGERIRISVRDMQILICKEEKDNGSGK